MNTFTDSVFNGFSAGLVPGRSMSVTTGLVSLDFSLAPLGGYRFSPGEESLILSFVTT